MAETMIGIRPINTRILVGIYDDGETTMTLGGKKFFLLDDTSANQKRDITTKHSGIRARNGIVLAISDHVQKEGAVKVGDKVLMEHGRWTRAIKAHLNKSEEISKIWSIPIEDVYGIDDEPYDEAELAQIAKLYPDWETWETVEA